jgi:Plasmid encoded RepA protein
MDKAAKIINEAVVHESLGTQEAIAISSRIKKKAISIEAVRRARDDQNQRLGYNSRPFILCGLPLKRLPENTLLHIRRNGKFFLRVVGDPQFGLPFGQDRLIPLWIATLAVKQRSRVIHFSAAADMLENFGLPKDGRAYRRLTEGFKRIFAATIFFGTEQQLKEAAVWDWARFHFFDRLQVWFSRNPNQPTLPDGFRNTVVLSQAFWDELQEHPIPVNLEAVKAFANAPGKLDLYMWLAWRCQKQKEATTIPLFGAGGLVDQLGVAEGYSRSKRKFRQLLRGWLQSVRMYWPECPAALSNDGENLLIDHALEITTSSTQD